jgi:pimeloyl-ACP methyl ester carboxylesterase
VRFNELPDRPRRPHTYFDAKPVSLEMDSAPFGRIRIQYRTCGAGPPLLLIHGLMTSGYSWRYVLAGLGERFRVFVPDLPGCGRSEKPADRSYRAAALATWIGEFQAAVGIAGCDAVGNSLGGYLCMRRALDDPHAFARLVNIHSPALPELRLRALRLALAIPGVTPGLALVVRNSAQRWAHRNVHYHDETLKSLEEAREYGDPLATRAGARVFVRYLRESLAPADLAKFVATLKQRRDQGLSFPVALLLIYSRRDPMVPPKMGDALHALVPSAPLVWLEDASHFTHVDAPETVIRTVLEFVSTHDCSRS